MSKWKLVQEIVRDPVSLRQLNGVDLSNVDIRCADLSGANLIGANLSGTNLRCVDLSGANLSGANLTGADLRGRTDFRGNGKGLSNDDLKTLYFNRRLNSPDSVSAVCLIRDFAAALRLARDLIPTPRGICNLSTFVCTGVSFALKCDFIQIPMMNCTVDIDPIRSDLVHDLDLDLNDIAGRLDCAEFYARSCACGHLPDTTWQVPAAGLALSLSHLHFLIRDLAQARSCNAPFTNAVYYRDTIKNDFVCFHFFVRAFKLAIAACGANLRGANLSGAIVENAQFGPGVGLTTAEKFELQQRGALFEPIPG